MTERVQLSAGTVLFRQVLNTFEEDVLKGLLDVEAVSPPRVVKSPFGTMSVRITNAGAVGWYATSAGYDYLTHDPWTTQPWPKMPDAWRTVAERAAAVAGYPAFDPDSCLVNNYSPVAKLGLHCDKDEADFKHPIVSVSLGLDAVFGWGGLRRRDPIDLVTLSHGDVLVFGGPDRLRYHLLSSVSAGVHPKLGARRINLTFRRAR